MLRMVICDWNGTLFADTLEEAFFFGLCRRAFFQAVRRADARKAARLGALGVRCYRQYLLARRDPQHVPRYIARIVGLLDADVFSGLTREDVTTYARGYARRIQRGLDRRLLEPLRALRAEVGVPLGVISAGCRAGIEAALAEAGAAFDFVIANEFRWAGDVTAGFEFRIADDKHERLDRFLAGAGIDPADVMYIGDSPQDEACFDLVGLPVLSFRATEEHKRRFARDCGAFAPASRAEFEAYLRQAASDAATRRKGRAR
jgi:phosphoserine phosphatase